MQAYSILINRKLNEYMKGEHSSFPNRLYSHLNHKYKNSFKWDKMDENKHMWENIAKGRKFEDIMKLYDTHLKKYEIVELDTETFLIDLGCILTLGQKLQFTKKGEEIGMGINMQDILRKFNF